MNLLQFGTPFDKSYLRVMVVSRWSTKPPFVGWKKYGSSPRWVCYMDIGPIRVDFFYQP